MNISSKIGLSIGAAISTSIAYIHFSKPIFYTRDEISTHNSLDKKVYVSYKDSVYDITEFIPNHPGGVDKIMLAAGKDLQPYWKVYKQHTNNPSILKDILEPLKIGLVKDYLDSDYGSPHDPFLSDPIRNPILQFHCTAPCNAETPIDQIMGNWITPNNLWYIRNHHPTPILSKKEYTLKINISKISQKEFTLDQLMKLDSKKVVSTMQCCGNRRGEFKLESGTPWGIGAISTAEWVGVPLCILLQNIPKNTKHVHFKSYDGVKASIPIEKALDPKGDVILAYQMNGKDLPIDHGFPVRIIVPGYAGIRNIKWLKQIQLSDREADGLWQQGIAYKSVPHYIRRIGNLDLNKIAPIQEMPVQSCITNMDKDSAKGFAWSGGGRRIIRVDVSFDNGKTWQMADLKEGAAQPYNRAWAWVFWEAHNEKENGTSIVVCKAIDEAYNTQPKELELAWNIRGLNNNSWHQSGI